MAQKSLCTWHLASHTSRSVRKAAPSQPAAPMFVICCLLPHVDRCSHSFCTRRQCSTTLRDSLHLLLPLSHTRVCVKTCLVQTARAGPCKDAFWLSILCGKPQAASLLPCPPPCWDPLSSFLKRISLSVHLLNFRAHQGPREFVLTHSGKAVASCGSTLWSLESMPGCNSDVLGSL